MKKTYRIRLNNADENGYSIICELTTAKTLREFEEEYIKIRKQWFYEDSPDCLFDYLCEKLNEKGFELYEIEEPFDLEIVF